MWNQLLLNFVKNTVVIRNPLKYFEKDILKAIRKVNTNFPKEIYRLQVEIECNEVIKGYIQSNQYSEREASDLATIAERIINKELQH